MVKNILLIFCTVSLVYSKCQDKPGSNIKLCDIPPNEEIKVQTNGSNFYIRLNSIDVHLRDLSRPLIQLGEQHYHFVTYLKVNYFNAFKYCGNLGLDLLSIESKRENDLIVSYIKENYGTAKAFWTSGEDLGSQGDYVWLANGKIFSFTDWGPGKPDNLNNDEHCVLINKGNESYFWDDSNCWGRHFAICEVPHCPYLC